nr:TonB-dependent receptor [Alteraurantiacibacter buctensis]
MWNGVAVSVFDRADIEAVQGADLTRLLERAPGVVLSRNGGTGSFTALRVRGAEAEQVLVLVDGVRLADPAAPGAGFDLGTLMLGNLAKVELQRSANSTLWGSQALGGVLAVTSAVRAGPAAAVEYGGHDSSYATASAAGELGPLDLGISGGWRDSAGFSAAAGGTEADSHRQFDLSGRIAAHLTGQVEAFAQGRLADARLETDGFPFPAYLLADTAEYQAMRQISGAAGLAYYGRDLTLRTSYSAAETERQNYDPAFGSDPGYATRGTRERIELRGQWGRITDRWQVQFGADYEWLGFSTLFDAARTTGIGALFAQLDYDESPLHFAIGLRRDEHRQFGGEWSLGTDAAYDLGRNLRLTASYGEGYMAPSLFQLLSDYGNAELRPERARSYDAGLAFDGVVGGHRARLALTAFRRDTRDQVVFESCFMVGTGICAGRPNGTYDNRARTRAFGLEAEAGLWLAEGLELAAVYALTQASDRTPGSTTRGNALARRPRHAATISAQWQPVERLSLAADLRLVSHAFDDGANRVRLGSYQVLNLRGAHDLSDLLQLFARIENLTDTTYQTAAGYAQAGRVGYVGARLRL